MKTGQTVNASMFSNFVLVRMNINKLDLECYILLTLVIQWN